MATVMVGLMLLLLIMLLMPTAAIAETSNGWTDETQEQSAKKH